MFDRLRQGVLQVARVPAAPQPPHGAPDSVRVFRAGRNFYRLHLLAWFTAQLATAFGIIFSLGFLQEVKENLGADEPAAALQPIERFVQEVAGISRASPVTEPGRQVARQFARQAPPWVLPLLLIGEVVGIAAYLLQLPVTFAAVRLDYELRWYMVTDRSLRLRSGIWVVNESTMSFANLQQVEMRQGPLQRLLGIADLRVQSAGGGSGSEPGKGHADSLHTVVFRGVEQAPEIRDLILERLRRYRASGLGDPDDAPDHEHGPDAVAVPALEAGLDSPPALAAAREVLAEARALRTALSRLQG
jgi:membrane protein YdbS with pleckstrin-like domain